jgi:beta-galactosidase beta subunit
MTATTFELLVLAIAIIAGLSFYAWRLTRQVNALQQAQRKEEAAGELHIRQHQEELVNDIRFIARAVIAGQCEITEGVIRTHYLLHGLDANVWARKELNMIRHHFNATRDMPILQAYKELPRKDQFALDSRRFKLEAQHKAAIEREFRWLSSYSFPQVTLLQ